MTVFGILAIYFIVINLTGFAMMGIDKRKAVKNFGGFQNLRSLSLPLLAEALA